ncbi:ABC transporter ATP-binding protein [Flavobacterium nitrogenifigens]|uniref:ABC-type multidrug transport system, ATPase component n=1 Tax=Flavobacterium nitrogenifigens TaxID=1617283 RepID=A0A521DYA7_9FLAO|nr:ABC transporter ATP-binding protein [Flavobacterium nitrogenifigens]KAF2333989.1 ABC transporter ATP-binding protein [Flavobacterium nitrogenifigens]SMO76588.1 ABC-type multidrug transport system, ATPase component [Flavobacterium nitrogenifigens]
MSAVTLKNITKKYGDFVAVDEVSFEVQKGELFGLIGPDGAGKTSIFRILTTLLLAEGGTASVEGHDVVKEFQEIRNKVGYMPGKFSLYQDLTVKENLEFFATIFGTTIEENYELIKDIYDQIKPFNDRRAGKLSGGMKQKLALCCALIHKPEVLFLDEPTTGVDVVSRSEFWEMLGKLKKQNITIVVSTPYMDEAKLCDRIALIQNGKIMTVDEPQEIINRFPKMLFAVKAKNIYKLLQNLRTEKEVENCDAFGEFLHLTLVSEQPDVEKVKAIAQKYNPEDLEVKKIEPTIEDSFIRLMREQNHLNEPKEMLNGK